jgi:branched-subunit amino acid aminotransferase/4-amino-4-deoxychorismate lyase
MKVTLAPSPSDPELVQKTAIQLGSALAEVAKVVETVALEYQDLLEHHDRLRNHCATLENTIVRLHAELAEAKSALAPRAPSVPDNDGHG